MYDIIMNNIVTDMHKYTIFCTCYLSCVHSWDRVVKEPVVERRSILSINTPD